MSEENKALMRRWFEEVWNKGRAEAIPEMFADEGIAHGLSDDPASPMRGPAGFLPFHTQFREAFQGGESVEDFLEAFPTVSREQVIAVIEAGKLKMLETV